VPLEDLDFKTEYHAISTQATLRNLSTFTNDTDNDIFVITNHATNFGSDGRTVVNASSSGDVAFGADDRWVITDDFSSGGDPTNITVFFGPDSPPSSSVFTTQSVFDCAGTQGLNVRIDVNIPASEQRSLLFFHSMATTESAALEAVTQFDTTPAPGSDLPEGLSETQLQDVVNWRF